MSAIYTFEIALWPSPKRETLHFICESEEQAWTALLQDQPTIGALYELVKTEELTTTQTEIFELADLFAQGCLALSKLERCKQRALSYVEQGNLTAAVASMIRDLELDQETAGITPQLVSLGIHYAHARDADAVREWIEGFA